MMFAKKTLFLLLLLGACTGWIEKKPETSMLVQVRDEPVGCEFLYRLEVDALVYSEDDAIAYLENRIVDQARKGNTYWIVSIRTTPKEWKVFGEDRSYVITTNVYKCPENANVITKADLEKSSDYQLYDWDGRD